MLMLMGSLFAELARQASANARREVETYVREIPELGFLDVNPRGRGEALEYAVWFRRRTVELAPDNGVLTDDDLGYIASMGEARAGSGMSLDSRQRVLRVHTELMLREINEATEIQRGGDVDELMRIMSWFAPQGERGIGAYRQGFVTAMRRRLPYVAQVGLLARSLLDGDPIAAELALVTGLELAEYYVVTVIRVPDCPVGDRDLEKGVEALLRVHRVPVTWCPERGGRGGELIVLLPGGSGGPPGPDEIQGTGAPGDPRGPGGLRGADGALGPPGPGDRSDSHGGAVPCRADSADSADSAHSGGPGGALGSGRGRGPGGPGDVRRPGGRSDPPDRSHPPGTDRLGGSRGRGGRGGAEGSGGAGTVRPPAVPADLVQDFAQAVGHLCAVGTAGAPLSGLADALGRARRISRAAPLRPTSARLRSHTLADVFVELAVADVPFVDTWLRTVARRLAPGPDLLLTLDAYYRHDMNRGPTAEALNVHPRTLDYRLRRVRELTDIDPGSTHGVRILSAVVVRSLSGGWR